MGRIRVDAVAGVSAVLALVMAFVHVAVTQEQGGEPAAWPVAVLIGGAVAAAYGAVRGVPYGRASLVLAGLSLVVLGVLAMLTLGLPILVAGALSLVAAVRPRRVPAP